ncbi:hypothetical protein, partial [Agromyces seonyuensis]
TTRRVRGFLRAERLRLLAAAALALSVAASALVPVGLEAALRTTPAERGVYDLLVRALPEAAASEALAAGPDGEPTEGGEDSDDSVVADGSLRLPPNTLLSPGVPRLTANQLDTIRAAAGVDVAAPITQAVGEWGQWRGSGGMFAIPVAVGDPDAPTETYRVRIRIADG